MLVPRDSVVDFLMQYIEPSAPPFNISFPQTLFVRYFIARISKQDNCDHLLPIFRGLCTRLWQLDEPKGLGILPEPVVCDLLQAVIRTRDWEFLEQVASRLGGYPPVLFFKWV